MIEVKNINRHRGRKYKKEKESVSDRLFFSQTGKIRRVSQIVQTGITHKIAGVFD